MGKKNSIIDDLFPSYHECYYKVAKLTTFCFIYYR